MRNLGKHVVRIFLLLALGGFLGATLVRIAPGFGVNEEDLDIRIGNAGHVALHAVPQQDTSLAHFYFDFWDRLLHGDLGESAALQEPVRRLLAERMPETAKTIAVGLALAWTLGLGAAFASLVPRLHWVHWGASAFSSVILCTPAAVLAIFFVLARLPVRLAVGVMVLPKVYHFSRGLLQNMTGLPHVLAARARGLGEFRILGSHIVRVATPQIIALAGVTVSTALAVCIPLEALCDSPGIGQLAWQAALGRDLPLLVNLTLIVTLITLSANLAADLIGIATPKEKQP